ncbi:MAG: Cytochrome c class I [Candidatus Gallionella acididurans]|uniref:Cytochrome c class I n=1 Tax=Candidatus Gallionella acididurans TaxID=1796491 RepID=A0A139BX21_9PROT|nr:MAG: Cytochrome c class I [Candidatus Gallionella acididurans]
MKIRYLMCMLAGLSVSATAFAAGDAEALFIKSKCNACHMEDKRLLGPKLKDIAARYAGDPGAQAMLEKKVRSGGSGAWGTMPMPRVSNWVSDADIKTLVAWILSQK